MSHQTKVKFYFFLPMHLFTHLYDVEVNYPLLIYIYYVLSMGIKYNREKKTQKKHTSNSNKREKKKKCIQKRKKRTYTILYLRIRG